MGHSNKAWLCGWVLVLRQWCVVSCLMIIHTEILQNAIMQTSRFTPFQCAHITHLVMYFLLPKCMTRCFSSVTHRITLGHFADTIRIVSSSVKRSQLELDRASIKHQQTMQAAETAFLTGYPQRKITNRPWDFKAMYADTGQKIANFDPNRVFPERNSSLNSPMALKLCTKLDTLEKRCPIVFRGHPSNSRSHGLKNRRFESNLNKISRLVTAIKSLRFALFPISNLSDGLSWPTHSI